MKAAIEREESDARINFSEREQARPQVKNEDQIMRNYRIFITGLLLSLITLTVFAQETISLQGCRRGTPRPQSVHLRRGFEMDRMPGGDFYHGERHQLVVLAAFNDRLFKDEVSATMEEWNKIFNTEHLTEAPFKGSVHDYFLDQSYGDFSVVFDLEYVQVGGDAAKYASNDIDDENSQYLVDDVVDILRTRDIDWGKYDWNGDGYVNQLLIIYAGYGMNDSDEPDLIWPHQWWMSEHMVNDDSGSYREPLSVSSGDKEYLVDCYCALAELLEDNPYGSFGTICHEYSHCFGLPDFYYGSRSVLYTWDLMDSGNYNGDGMLPASYSAHERWLMGWLTPIELTEKTTITDMPALAEEGRAYLIRNDGCENEYYIVENRQPKGWDEGLPGSGILVFHIDYDPSVWTSTSEYPNSSKRKRYEIFQANYLNYMFDRAGWAYPYEDNNSLTNTSLPVSKLYNNNADGSKLMSKPITNMAITDGRASFDFCDTPTGVNGIKSGSDQLLYRFGVVDIVRDSNGVVRKVVRKLTGDR